MFGEGDLSCINKLMIPVERVLRSGTQVRHEAFAKRIELWNNIRENQDRFLDGECGRFLKDLDLHFRAQFDAALLSLAASFKANEETFSPASYFTDEEIEAYMRIERYQMFDLINSSDLKIRLMSRDRAVLELLRDFYVYMDNWMNGIVYDDQYKITVRAFLKKRWGEYKKKLNEAISNSILELDYLGRLIGEWEREAALVAAQSADNARKETEESYSLVEDELYRELLEKEDELRSRMELIEEREEEIEKLKEEIVDKEERIREVLQKKDSSDSRFVSLGEVKHYEMNFINRMELNLDGEVKMFGRTFLVEAVREFRDESASGLAKAYDMDPAEAVSLPENRMIVAGMTEKKAFGRRLRLVAKAIFLSRIERYASEGYDTEPITLIEINRVLSESRERAKSLGKKTLLCIGSPTGFTDDAVRHIGSEEFHKNFISRYLSVCLTDLETAELYYNPHDNAAKGFALLCRLEFNEEMLARTRRCMEELIEAQNGSRDWILYDDVAEECGRGDQNMLKAVFYEVADSKGWKVRYVDDVGLAMVRPSGGGRP